MAHNGPKLKSPLSVVFYKSDTGNEPVREWLKRLTKAEKKTIGEDIKTVQLGWPLGMPLLKSLGGGLWEMRSGLDDKTARVFIAVHKNTIVLLHGLIKKSRQIPRKDLELARKRLASFKKPSQKKEGGVQ